MIGKKFTDALPGVSGSSVEKNLLKVLRTGQTHMHTELPFDIMRDGEMQTHFFTSTYQPLMEEGVIVGVIALVDEVTDQYLARKLKEQNEEDF
ncbi:hypothetical protein VF12_38465 [Nostoc linckia z15]|nr:hypothetical protein VF12_38465 [Nostoc linckia z15]